MTDSEDYGRPDDRKPIHLDRLSPGNDIVVVAWRRIGDERTEEGFFDGVVETRHGPSLLVSTSERGASLAIPLDQIHVLQRRRVFQPVWFERTRANGIPYSLNKPEPPYSEELTT